VCKHRRRGRQEPRRCFQPPRKFRRQAVQDVQGPFNQQKTKISENPGPAFKNRSGRAGRYVDEFRLKKR